MPEGLYDISMECLHALGTDDSVQSCLEFLQNFNPPHFSNGFLLPACQAKLKIIALCAITRGRMGISQHNVLGSSLERGSCIFKSSMKCNLPCLILFSAVRKINNAKF